MDGAREIRGLQQSLQMRKTRMSIRSELGVSMGLGENGKMAFAHKRHDTKEGDSKKSNFIAGQYSIGGITVYLGYAQHNAENDEATARGKIAKRENSVFQQGGPTGTFTQTADDQDDAYGAASDTLVTAAVKAVTKSTVNQTDKTFLENHYKSKLLHLDLTSIIHSRRYSEDQLFCWFP